MTWCEDETEEVVLEKYCAKFIVNPSTFQHSKDVFLRKKEDLASDTRLNHTIDSVMENLIRVVSIFLKENANLGRPVGERYLQVVILDIHVSVQEDTVIMELRMKLVVTLRLRNTQLDLVVAKYDLKSSQADLDAALSSHAERKLDLKNSNVALTNSELSYQKASRDDYVFENL
ncbi:hypothetical protein BGZ76_010570 [Entomortierella beljakovae]|nr:hypothetical protein BGZ76_010570 [Entomortierella beljakovae]